MKTGLIALHAIAKINGISVDLRVLEKDLASEKSELELPELLRLAKRLEFKTRVKKIQLEKITESFPCPAIIHAHDGSFAVLLRVNKAENKLLFFLPTERKTVDLSLEEASQVFQPVLVVMTLRTLNAQVRFGFQWFYSEILKFRRVILEVLSASFVVQLFGLVTPLFTQVILDKVIVHRTMSTLDVLAVAFLFTAGMEFMLNLARNQVFTQAANKIDAILGAKLFRHLFNLPFVYFESRRVGVIAARVRELDNIREFITSKSVSVLVDLFFSLVFVVMMFLYSVQLTFVVLGFVSLIAILYVILTPELRNRLEAKFQMASGSQSYLVESVTGVQTVKSLAIEGSMQRKWEDALAKYLQSSFNLSTMANVGNAISNLCQKMMTIAILYLGVRCVIENKLTIGQLIAFQMFSNQFTNPVIRLVNLWNEFQQALLGVDRLGDILNHPIEVQSSKAITLPKIQGEIDFDKVSFRYISDGPCVLKELSLKIRSGMSVGIVGRSGSGKSTVAKLLQRLYLATDGIVSIDGVDVRHLNPHWLRSNIGVVLQENYLFSGTIRENISMTKPDASIESILQSAAIAGAHEFISQMPFGYDTLVGERGSSLSGGQKQRIAIARALLTDPKILIFDEATSALDYESERIIQQNLQKIKADRTFIIIAHRLSTVRDCDLIVVLEQGEIIEMGSPSELLAKDGAYAKLYSQQLATGAAAKESPARAAALPKPQPEAGMVFGPQAGAISAMATDKISQSDVPRSTNPFL